MCGGLGHGHHVTHELARQSLFRQRLATPPTALPWDVERSQAARCEAHWRLRGRGQRARRAGALRRRARPLRHLAAVRIRGGCRGGALTRCRAASRTALAHRGDCRGGPCASVGRDDSCCLCKRSRPRLGCALLFRRLCNWTSVIYAHGAASGVVWVLWRQANASVGPAAEIPCAAQRQQAGVYPPKVKCLGDAEPSGVGAFLADGERGGVACVRRGDCRMPPGRAELEREEVGM